MVRCITEESMEKIWGDHAYSEPQLKCSCRRKMQNDRRLGIVHLPPSPIAIALLSCNLASPLDVPPPLNMPAGYHIGLVVLASPPCQWGCGVPPLPSRGYQRYGLVCRRGHCPWRRRPMSRDKDGTNNDGNDDQ
jgi:hypothetical protein